MNKDELYDEFVKLFPNWSHRAISYKKIGSKTIAITFATDVINKKPFTESRVFLYVGPDNWQFGTKLWRKRPEKKEKAAWNRNTIKEDN